MFGDHFDPGERMSIDQREGDAFYRATLNSEWDRIAGLLVVLGALLVFTLARGIMWGGLRVLWAQSAVLAIVISHATHVLREVKRAQHHNKDVPDAIWTINVVVESSLPTLALLLLLASKW